MATTEEWAAGFYDGEGHIRFDGRFYICITQKTPESLWRFLIAVGVGNVTGPYFPSVRGKVSQRYSYRAFGAEAVHVMNVLWPWLGTAKREQAMQAIHTWAA